MASIHWSALAGDLVQLRAILATGVDVDARRNGRPALNVAALNGHATCPKALLAAGASVHSSTVTDDVTALHEASFTGRAACVRALIAAGSDVNRADRYGNTPFTCALAGGHPRVLKILLRAGADVHTADVARHEDNTSAWALVDEIREVGGWANYVARYPPTTLASVVDKAMSGALPDPIPLIVATFLEPPGGY